MRIMIKGGVWKNTEDEILKAAVMKYGKNQWARISSLLVRKSAKQCKARWYEWLDPSIKKTEWTREEDEKLLHLAKLMPTQWRTIAPIVGRTPSQCLERYEKLLDAACAKDENYEPSDDPRKLRPGEIDPNPESKPARPDPVDMDEDEKEMLSEARARLANTRGKKAKRKAREKQLEEARRLASLQKRRELKAAGIDTRQRKRKRKGIDYNAEIPFEKRAPPGFYDVSGEERPVEQPKFPTTIEELEGKRRVDIEAQLRKQDIARNKIAQRQDAPAAILQANKLNDPEAVRKRSKLMLPAPQISDQELEEIAKMGYANDLVLANEELAEGSGATHALLANYSQTPRQGMTPLRTPQRTPAGKGDAIMMEAENLARLRESQTPLLGGENPELHPSDFSGVTPRKREIQTPNPMATPLATPGATGLTPRIGMTPSRDAYSFGATPKGTPFRDELHINEDMEMQDSAKLELRRQAELKKTLRSGLTNLPQPKNEYQIVIQPIAEENEETEEKIEEDMSDRIAREKAQEQARLEALLRKRSKVLQRELPRPPAASLELIRNSLIRGDEDKSSFVPPTLFEQADEMISKELLALLEHDNAKYPLDGKQEKEKKKYAKRVANGRAMPVPEIEDFDEDELKEADSLIKEEVEFLRVAMGHENEAFDDFVKARDACQEDLMYFPARDSYGLASIAGSSEKLAALQNEFEIMKKRMDDEAKKATRLEQKVKLLTQGYQTRAGKLWSQIEATYKQMDTAATELECFKALQKQEHLAASFRVSSLMEEVNKQKVLEQSLQQRYGDLLTEHDRIQRLLEEHKVQLRIREEIAAKNRALEEEIAARNRALEEEAAAKHGTLDEKLAENNQHGDTAQLGDVCRPDAGLDQTDLPNADHPETTSSCEQPIPSVPGGQLYAEGSAERKDAFEGQSTQSANVIQESLNGNKEHVSVVDKNAELSGGVAGFVNEQKEMVGSMVDAPAPVQDQIGSLQEQQTTVANSGGQVAGSPVIQPNISEPTMDPSASSDSAAQITACLSNQITVSYSTGLETMVVDSGDEGMDGGLAGCSNISMQVVFPVESGNADPGSAEQIAGDSSSHGVVTSAPCSEEKIHSDFSIRTAVNSADCALNNSDGGIASETNVSIPDYRENLMVESDDKAEMGDGK
ncbi:cell division cycle 5-like protein [Elaeis guineensis]|uniref:Cell division cycle 5-like protein n=1 Tax=Elaeis guineensis var. tenera TaxID=51953 RepID=A0A6I9QSZ5_ELAGV|nr:cell division cycle 5-like protein [Elaeis guineensis]